MQLPNALINSLQNAKGFSKEAFEQQHVSSVKVTSLRTNPFKWQQTSLSLIPPTLPLSSPVPWCTTGFYLSERPSFTLDPLFHAGCYYVQEASSMFIEQLIKTVYPDHATAKYKVLDLCAAPGGKTTHLSALFPESLIVANEVIKTRAGVLTENAVKWGKENVVVTSNDATDFKALQGYFDMIVTDAPCSGSGLFRKDPDAITEWSLQSVALCSKRQQRIIQDSWKALKENGIFIYSTCSYSVEENEAVLDWMAEAFEVETISVPGATGWGIVETVSDRKNMYGYRFYPDKIKGEGFFIACIRKKEAASEQIPKPKKFIMVSIQEQKAITPFLKAAEQFEMIRSNDEVKILKKCDMESLAILFSALYIKKLGTRAGRVMRDELIPSHDLALSTIIALNLKAIDADQETALDYLRKKDIAAGNAAPGWNVVRFMGHNLGWAKVLPNRVNNYYPSGFRILKH